MAIGKVGVIGAGVMGAGIAAQIANAGIPVVLLDIVPEGAENRNAVAEGAIARMLKADPAPFMTRRAAKRIEPGNVEDHLDRLGECDWILEAVVERLDVKQALYRQIDAVRKEGSIVSSNTSTLPLARLTEGLPDAFARDFMITHFFNPPRYMRLLELVEGPQTRAGALTELTNFADRRLGKGVVLCKDRPGFIANRIGTYWVQAAFGAAIDQDLAIEEADALMGRPLGIPKTGVFALMDLVGIDLMPEVDRNLAENLPAEDPYQTIRRDIPLIRELIDQGYTGRKGKGGFYRLNTAGGARVKEAIELSSGAYHPAKKPVLESLDAAKAAGREGAVRALLDHEDRGGRYAWTVMSATLAYAASLVPEIAEDIWSVDRAMQLGYNWKLGPFELIDRIGAAHFAEKLRAEGRPLPPLVEQAAEAEGFYRVKDGKLQQLTLEGGYRNLERGEGVLLLADVKRASEPLARNASASLWDLGDGVVCLEVHTKLNTIDDAVLALMRKAIDLVSEAHKALVIYNEASHFSAGANIGLALFAANTALWPMIEGMVAEGQKTYRALKYAPFPVVAAPSGLALGGGCEILMVADAVQAHAESYVGLVETGVGLVPAWGGCAELLARLASDPKRPRGPMPPVTEAFETIGMAKVAKSAFEARELGFLRESDGITFNRDRLLAEAKARALALADDYQAPQPAELTLPGPGGKTALDYALRDLVAKGVATAHDRCVAGELAQVLTGGPGADMTEPLGEDALLTLERESFMRLVRQEPTLARMEHTLMTGKPLRN